MLKCKVDMAWNEQKNVCLMYIYTDIKLNGSKTSSAFVKFKQAKGLLSAWNKTI